MNNSRRYDVDYLRVLAFLLLILYHIGMFYVADWGWHVKSAYLSDFLKNVMLLFNQWRMPLIFLISGIALGLVESKVSSSALFKARFTRIFIPTLIGMYIIVPPQSFYEAIQKLAYDGQFIEFYLAYINPNTNLYPEHHNGPLGLLTWNHLWYLVYLWHYTLVYLLVRPLLTRINWQSIANRNLVFPIYLFMFVCFLFAGIFLKHRFPVSHALVDDWYSHAYYFPVFFLGYALSHLQITWTKIIELRRFWCIAAIGSFSLFIYMENGGLNWLFRDIESTFALSRFIDATIVKKIVIYGIISINTLNWLMMVLALAGFYLNQRSRFLSYMNEAILPLYILHQTVIICVAMQLSKLSLGPIVEPLLVIVMTFAISFSLYEGIKRWSVTRFMFGMKPKIGNGNVEYQTAANKC